MKKVIAAILAVTFVFAACCVSVNADSDFEEFIIDGIRYYNLGFVGEQDDGGELSFEMTSAPVKK